MKKPGAALSFLVDRAILHNHAPPRALQAGSERARAHSIVASNASNAYIRAMASSNAPAATITIRNLDGRVKERLRIRAAQNGHSMEAEARAILSASLEPEPTQALNFVEAIRRHVEPLGGIELEDHPPVEVGEPPRFGR